MSLDVLNAALVPDAWEEHFGGEEEGRQAWAALRRQLEEAPTMRSTPFWAYEPDIPAEVRGTGTSEDLSDPDLELARLRWLLGPGKHHQQHGEGEALYNAMGRLEDELDEWRALHARNVPVRPA